MWKETGGAGGSGASSGLPSSPDTGPPPAPWQPREAEPRTTASPSACTLMAGHLHVAGPTCSQLGLHTLPSLGALDLTITYTRAEQCCGRWWGARAVCSCMAPPM